jgi:hypothetical protein
MGLQYRRGSIFTSTAQTLVVPVNCKGVAGRGLALQFRVRYPNWYQAYRHCCTTGELQVGRPLLHWGGEPWVLSFPTKEDWWLPSELAFIVCCAWGGEYRLSETWDGCRWPILGGSVSIDGGVPERLCMGGVHLCVRRYEEVVCMGEQQYDVALWVKSEIDVPGRLVLPEVAVYADAVSPLSAVQAVMWVHGLWYVHKAACSDGSGMIWRWSRLRNEPTGGEVL